MGVKLAFVSLDWNDGVSKGTSTVKMTDDSRPIKKQSKKWMRGTADDVAQTYMNVSRIMNSSTLINLL